MTIDPVNRVMAKIAEAKAKQPEYLTATENIARQCAFELCEMWIEHFILTEQFDEVENH